MVLIYCRGECQMQVPEINFEEDKLTEWRLTDSMHNAICARCVVKGMAEDTVQKFVKCQKCFLEKQLSEFTAVQLKGLLAGKRDQFKWRCFDCQFPRCSEDQCKNRPMYPIIYNGRWGG
jgi:hypothetical protein